MTQEKFPAPGCFLILSLNIQNGLLAEGRVSCLAKNSDLRGGCGLLKFGKPEFWEGKLAVSYIVYILYICTYVWGKSRRIGNEQDSMDGVDWQKSSVEDFDSQQNQSICIRWLVFALHGCYFFNTLCFPDTVADSRWFFSWANTAKPSSRGSERIRGQAHNFIFASLWSRGWRKYAFWRCGCVCFLVRFGCLVSRGSLFWSLQESQCIQQAFIHGAALCLNPLNRFKKRFDRDGLALHLLHQRASGQLQVPLGCSRL